MTDINTSTARLLSSLYGEQGKHYRSFLSVHRHVTRTALGQVEAIITTRSHGLPRPDDVLRNQMVMNELKEVSRLKLELEQRLGHKLELKPGQKLSVPALTMQLEDLKQKQHLELKHKLYPKLTPPGAPK